MGFWDSFNFWGRSQGSLLRKLLGEVLPHAIGCMVNSVARLPSNRFNRSSIVPFHACYIRHCFHFTNSVPPRSRPHNPSSLPSSKGPICKPPRSKIHVGGVPGRGRIFSGRRRRPFALDNCFSWSPYPHGRQQPRIAVWASFSLSHTHTEFNIRTQWRETIPG